MNIPKHYSLHSENDSHFVLHDGRDGKTFQVAKKDLHPAHQMKIMKIQKLSEGTPDEPVQQEAERAPATDSSDWQGSVGNMASATPAPTPQPVPISSEATTQPTPASGVQVGGITAPVKSQNEVNQFQANQAGEEAGLKAEGAARAKEGEANAKVYEDTNAKLAKLYADSNPPIEKLSQESDVVAHDIANFKIDPRRYYNNMSTGQKIGSAIAAIVSGIGAGASGTQNMALQHIHNAIQQDIESQKMDLGKKESLLSYNLAKYKDMKTSLLATASQMNAIAQGQIAANSARYGGLAAQGASMAALNNLKNNNLGILTSLKQQVFENQVKQHLASGDISKDNPLDYVKHVVPPEKQQKVFDEIGVAIDAHQNEPKILKAFDEAAKENTVLKTGAGLLREPGMVKALKQGILPLFKDIDSTVRQAAMDETFHNLVPSPGDSDKTNKEKRAALVNWLQSKKAAPTARGFGIDLSKFQPTQRAPGETKVVNGVTYTRGPNGEAIPVQREGS